MTLEQAERLLANDDFKAFLLVLEEDSKAMTEDLVIHTDVAEIMRTQCKIQVLRGVRARLGHVIDSLRPETPASDQETVSPA